MKKYISISKKAFEKKFDVISDTHLKLVEVMYSLKSIADTIDLKDEEIEIIEKSQDMLMSKLEKLEKFLDDENNEFYNPDNVEEIW